MRHSPLKLVVALFFDAMSDAIEGTRIAPRCWSRFFSAQDDRNLVADPSDYRSRAAVEPFCRIENSTRVSQPEFVTTSKPKRIGERIGYSDRQKINH
jgi:hypothetical protein